jgi:hypothetical protein
MRVCTNFELKQGGLYEVDSAFSDWHSHSYHYIDRTVQPFLMAAVIADAAMQLQKTDEARNLCSELF